MADQPLAEPAAEKESDDPESPDGTFAAGATSGTAPVDDLTEQALARLEQPPAQRQWWHTAAVLGVSLFLFGAAGLFSYQVSDLAILVGVLLFHECGHYLGMRLFNYQDVRMFFIPFFGAAVSGRDTNVPGYQQAIVILLGPLPGIGLGLALGIACLYVDEPLLRSAVLMLLGINVFNLLPFLPLDGGRLLHLVLFSRQRHLEALFRVVAVLLLGVMGYFLEAWLLVVLAAFMLLSTGYTFRVSSLAQALRRSHVRPSGPLDAALGRDEALPLIQRVRETFPQMNQSQTLANTVRTLWERLHASPPGALASVGLMAVYCGTLLTSLVGAALLHLPVRSVVDSQDAGAPPGHREETRVLGRLRESTDLDDQGRYHGQHLEYFPVAEGVAARGRFHHGRRHGEWTFYREDGSQLFRQQYEHGKLLGGPPGAPAGDPIPRAAPAR